MESTTQTDNSQEIGNLGLQAPLLTGLCSGLSSLWAGLGWLQGVVVSVVPELLCGLSRFAQDCFGICEGPSAPDPFSPLPS